MSSASRDAVVYAGTIGWGVWSSADLGNTWQFAFRGPYAECRVWSMSWHEKEPDVVWAGSDQGVLRQGAEGAAEHVPSPADGKNVWSIAQLPNNPESIFVGTHPGALYRSDDSGMTWRSLPIQLAEECLIGKPRITRIRFDPFDENILWVSAEIDGVHCSRDGGETWVRYDEGFRFPDIHDIAIVNDDGKRRLLAATAVGFYSSSDDGQSWDWLRMDTPWQYTRGLKPRADLDGTVFLCNGDGPPGSTGRLLRSRDWGRTWEDAGLPQPTNSTPWMVATNESDPSLLFACTNLGQMFRSTDGGERWSRLPRELGEIRTMLWHPA